MTLKYIWHHPFAGKHRSKAVGAYLRWQVLSRCLRDGAAIMPFTGKTKLYIVPNLHGATGNIYLGLHEFHEMSFLLHFLRPEDLFFDIGANVGSYTVLAAGHCGARTITCEPVDSTYRVLSKNVALNELAGLAQTRQIAVGDQEGSVSITEGLDAKNHVVQGGDSSHGTTVEVPVTTLDLLASDGAPRLIKIDVEGYESFVFRGGTDTLANEGLEAIIVELSPDTLEESHERLTSNGFTPFRYEPFTRKLEPRDSPTTSDNLIYVRDSRLDSVRQRLAESSPVDLPWQSF